MSCGQPCPYCFHPGPEPEEGWMIAILEGNDPQPECGFADTHPECQAMVEAYMEEVRREGSL